MNERSVSDLESQGSFVTLAGSLSTSLSFARRRSNRNAAELVLPHDGVPSDRDDTDASSGTSHISYNTSGRVNSSARIPSDRDQAAEISVQLVSQKSYDEDMKRKYAKHLKTSERLTTEILVSLRIEDPQKALWVVIFLLIFGLSFMAQFLQNLPASKAAHVARRHGNPDILGVQFQMFSWGLPISKGAAHAIKVTILVIFFPVARTLLTFLRRAPFLKRVIPFDSNLTFHRFFGYILFLFSWIHTFGHVANSINQTKKSSNMRTIPCHPPLQNCTLGEVRLECLCSPYEIVYGQTKYGNPNTRVGWWTSETSITGIVLLAILCMGYPCAVLRSSTTMRKIIKDTSFIGKRMYSFTWFFFTHQFMTISFLIVAVLHPLPGLPGNPRPHSSTTWVYVLAGLAAYVVDRTLRLYRQAMWETTVLGARILPGGVLELKLKKPRNTKLWRAPQFSYKPGQYAHLNVPQISFAEWHPFTITSVPADDFIMFHIKSAGDWTALLHDCISKQLGVDGNTPSLGPRLTGCLTGRLARSGQVQTPLSDVYLNSMLGTSDLRDSELSKSASCVIAPTLHVDRAKFRCSTMPSGTTSGASVAESSQLPSQSLAGPMGEESINPSESNHHEGVVGWKAPIIHVDGPCGAPAQHYKNYQVLLLVGGNIGVTPFISILRKILTNMELNRCSSCGECDRKHIKHKQVYFFWTLRDAAAVQNFKSTFAAVKKLDTHGILDIRIHLTSMKAGSHDLQASSSLGLTVRGGRPDWRCVFQMVCQKYPTDTVGVFCCGPLALTQDLKVLSREYSVPRSTANGGTARQDGQATKFDFFQEHF